MALHIAWEEHKICVVTSVTPISTHVYTEEKSTAYVEPLALFITNPNVNITTKQNKYHLVFTMPSVGKCKQQNDFAKLGN